MSRSPRRRSLRSRAAIESFDEPFRLAGLSLATTLTGSALIALALAEGALDVEAAWNAAHVDEDWNIFKWGEDAEAARRRARRFDDFRAAALALSAGHEDVGWAKRSVPTVVARVGTARPAPLPTLYPQNISPSSKPHLTLPLPSFTRGFVVHRKLHGKGGRCRGELAFRATRSSVGPDTPPDRH